MRKEFLLFTGIYTYLNLHKLGPEGIEYRTKINIYVKEAYKFYLSWSKSR
jgi:hypothetical protein